ncbi:leucine-rich repeat-containing G-protein coupled receptor 6-like [Limulus polyphemus]|uniref:Leucine-rich repeat-containing G-protein coupled receptor 6-like n=1 Tax=Limulus polyphemus TaxID=6850 RepID=A0ABM1TNX0_LIMPO|nr:leucine-rich repeat-containing G-protein coupled receptor 6-like [Limulus polyphemus]XP_022257576.1 leucine-rich repeat-containing G-protein coupled receptor 6-like [Limulus polyphemus]
MGGLQLTCFCASLVLTVASILPPNCPDKEDLKPCTCDYEGINCFHVVDSNDLKRAMQTNPSDPRLRSFWLTGTELTEIKAYTFQKYSIVQMFLDFNRLNKLEDNAFVGGSESTLVYLGLSNNEFTSYPMNALRILKALISVNFENNKITKVPNFAFKSSKDLVEVNLANNVISHVGKMAFVNLRKLRKVDLSNNQLVSVGILIFPNTNIVYYKDSRDAAEPDASNTEVVIELQGNPIGIESSPQ